MKENLGGREPGIIERYRKFIFGESEPSGDASVLLAPGKVEELVREGRTPLMIGTMGSMAMDSEEGFEMQPLYEIPPVGFAGKDMKEVYGSMGVHIFVNKLGVKRFGSTFTLTESQVEEVENRIKAERERFGITLKAK